MNRFAKGCTLDRGRHRYTSLHIARARGIVATASASSSSLKKFAPPVYNQTAFGCCEGASSSAATYLRFGAKGSPLAWLPSVVGIYTPARCLDRGDPSAHPLQDVGTQTNSVIRAISDFGIRPMGYSPSGLYCDVTDSTVNAEPDLAQLEQSSTSLVIGAYQITTSGAQKLRDVQDCIASGVPVRVDSFVDMKFEDWRKGNAPIGAPDYSDPQGGGHALYAYAYSGSSVLVRNSWGPDWGDDGDILASPEWLEQADCYAWDVQKAFALYDHRVAA